MFALLMDQPSIHLFGYLIHEPVTSITNLILCAGCLMFGLQVRKSHATYWVFFFYCLSFATFFAAFGHGMFSDKNNILQLISRIGNITAIYVMTVASILLLKNHRARLLLNILASVQFLIAVVLMTIENNFLIVQWDGIIGVGLFVAVIHAYLYIKGNKASRIILVGIIVNATTAIIFSNKISISKWFNHNDISHVILLIGFYIIARGASKLQHYATK